MADPRDPRRSRAALLALGIAAIATIGTSPAPPETTALSATGRETVHLDRDAPRAAFEMTIKSNAAAWPAGGDLYQAVARFTAASVSSPDLSTQPSAPAYEVILSATDGAERVSSRTGVDGFEASTDLRSICGSQTACERTYRVLIGLTGSDGGPVDVELAATADLTYLEGRQPPNAELSLSVEPVEAGPMQPLGFGMLSGEATLDVSNPIVVHELVLRRPAPVQGALADAGRMALRVDVEPEPGRNSSDYLPVEAILTAPRAAEFEHAARPWDHQQVPHIDPFARCPVDVACEVPLVLAFRWPGGTIGERASFTWQLDAWAAANGPGDAPFELRLERELAVERGGATLTATTSGTVELTADEHNVNLNHWLYVPADVLAAAGFEGGQIGGVARVRASSRADGALPGDVQVRVALYPGEAGEWMAPMDGSAEIATDVMPGPWDSGPRGCADIGCYKPIGLSVWIADHQRAGLAGARVSVEWTMEVSIFYFGAEQPSPGAALQLEPVEQFQ